MDIKSLGLGLDTSNVERGLAKLDALVDAAERAEAAEERLAKSSKEAGEAVAEMGASAQETAEGMSAVEATTRALAESEEDAAKRIREMVRASLDRQQAMLAAASATRTASQATRELSESQRGSRADSLGGSFAESQQELEALSDAMAHQAQSLDDIGERRAWVTELYDRGLISLEDNEAHLKTLDRQEKELTRSMEAHAREVEHLLRTYDPASAALAKIAEDERRLADALRSGAISAQQHAKAMAGLDVNRARWKAEAEGIKEAAKQINYLALSSTAAFRDYGTLAGALSRGDFTLASNQILQLSSRAGALRALLTPLAAGIGASAAAAGVMAAAFHQGQKESFELHKALVLSGNAAGVTAGQLGQMAERLDEIVGTRAGASAVLGQLAATGRVAAEDLERFAEVTQLLARNGVQPAEDTVRILSELGRAPVEASIRLNEQTHHLTDAIYEQIVALQARGEFEKAGALAQQAYADYAVDAARRIEEQLPLLDRAAKTTTGFFKEMWDAISGIGRPETPESELAKLRERRGNRPLYGGRALYDQGLENTDRREEALARQVEANRAKAEAEGRQKRETAEKIRTQAESAARMQAAKAIADAESGARAAAIQRELNNTLAQYSAYESELEALRDAGLISETDYYNEKRRLIEQNRDANIEALKFENQRIAAENARTQALTGAQKGNAKTPAEVAQIEAQAQAQLIANQSKIAENEARIANLRGDAISQLNVLETQEKARGKALERSYDNARAAAQAYLDVLTQQQDRELNAMGSGSRARERNETRNRIEDRFVERRDRLESDRRTGPQTDEAQQRYEQDLALLKEFRDRELRADESYWERRTELEGDFWIGAREAMQNYIDDAQNVAKQSERLFTNAFEGMTDALTNFAMTGKADFKSLANSIIADLLRIQLRTALANIFSNSGSSGGGNVLSMIGTAIGGMFGGGKAEGGSVEAGRTYLVGEKGPEIVRMGAPGVVIPNHKIGGGPAFSFGPTYISGEGLSVAQVDALVQQRNRELENRIAQNLSRGRWDAVA